MNLGDFSGEADIFVDANIFTYFALGTPAYQDACAEFLNRIEDKRIHAVTSDFVLNEVFYALLVGKGSELLATTKITTIKKQLLRDATLAAACYQVCQEFWGYLLALQAEGLRIVNVGARTGKQFGIGRSLPLAADRCAACGDVSTVWDRSLCHGWRALRACGLLADLAAGRAVV